MARRHRMIWVLGWFLAASSAAPAAGLEAGAAVADITPPTGFPLWGYAARHDAPSVGVLDRLHARALVLACGKSKVALVGLDLGRAPTRPSVAAIRQAVWRAGISDLFLVASHTHHGPVIELDNWPAPERSYVRELERKLAAVVLEADGKLRPARYGVVSREVSGFNHNRHSRRDDAPSDHELLVLRVEEPDGKPIAHAVNFAAHPTLLDSRLNQLSADYPGALCTAVEKETGVPCLFLQGAAGDQSPGPKNCPWSHEEFGKRLAGEVLASLPRVRCSAADKPSLRSAREELHFRSQLDLENAVLRFSMGRAFFPELIDFYRREYRDGVRPQLTLGLLDDRVAFAGVSGEFFSGHALSLKRRARVDHVFFLGYCNDYHQYFPTIEAVSEKGYGTLPPMAPVEFGAGERVVDRALLRLYQMRGLIPELPAKP